MMSSYNFEASQYENKDVDMWAQESYELSVSNVYTGITENTALPEEYIKKNQQEIVKKIVLGGLRLAYVIQSMFGTAAVETQQVFLQ